MQKYLESEEELFHYTGINALHSIIKTKKLRLSDLRFLNDSREIKSGLSFLKLVLTGVRENYNYANNEKIRDKKSYTTFLENLIRWVNQKEFEQGGVYGISFAEDGDLLSQWRGYSEGKTGVNFSLSKNDLIKLANQHNGQLVRCLYEFEDCMSSIQEYVIKEHDRYFDCRDQIEPEDALYKYFEVNLTQSILILISSIKDCSFAEEKEWRLMVVIQDLKNHDIKYIPNEKIIIPYIEIDLSKIEVQDPLNKKTSNCLFRSISVGPSAHQALALNSIKRFCNATEATPYVYDSEIPFREK